MPVVFNGILEGLNAISHGYSGVPALKVLEEEIAALFKLMPSVQEWSLFEWDHNEIQYFGSKGKGMVSGEEATNLIRQARILYAESEWNKSFSAIPLPQQGHFGETDRQFAIRHGSQLLALLNCQLSPGETSCDTENICLLIATHLGHLTQGSEWDSLFDPALITDESGIILRWNTLAENVFGIGKGDMKQLHVGEMLKLNDADISDLSLQPELLKQNAGKRIVMSGIRRSGELFPLETDITLIQCRNASYYKLVLRDISVEKRASADLVSMTTRLSTLIHNLEAGILVEDENRRIALINKHFCNLFKIPVEPEMMLGIDCSRAADDSGHMFSNPGHFSLRIQQIIRELRPVIGEELELPNGIFFERDYLPIIAGDTFLGHLWQYRDITHRKNTERALRKATEDAEAASYAKTRFLANMSHEIRTPLNAIVGMIRLLADTDLNTNQKKLLQHLNTSSGNLLNIVNDILDFSKIESGQIDMEHCDFDIHHIFRNIYDLNKYKAREKNLNFRVESDERIATYLRGDAVRLQQILLNLLSNAIKFTDKGDVVLKNELLSITQGSCRILFSVSDTGIGISKDNQKKIFDSFKQEDESTTRIYGGTGLGLAISSQLVSLMGGQLEVHSRKNEGSTFSFIISLPAGMLLDKQSSEPAPEPEANSLPGVRVLLVEDNKFNQFIAKALLEKWGAIAELAENGQHAIELLQINSYDLILMDIQMPVMDGITATSIIRERLHMKAPILALTANVVKGVSEKCIEAGMDGYVSKPFDPGEFHRKITSVLNLRSRSS
jgi:PAS domain S-box-containing protein